MGPKPLNRHCGKYCLLVPVWVCLVAFRLLLGVESATAAVFTQETFGVDGQGNELPQVIIDPASRHDLVVHHYDLGNGRSLEIQTNTQPTRQAEIDTLAATVRRCYRYLEMATERAIPGGVLLYLMEFEERPRLYRFQTETRESDNWSQVRLAMLAKGQALLGAGASRHVNELVYDTLPHELGHSLMTVVPTVRHDRDGQSSQGTRWFIDGVCELLAKGFAAQEAPDFFRQALAVRSVASSSANQELFDCAWRWGQENELSWSTESDMYGVSLKLMTAWTRQAELPVLLNLMAARGGDLDGEDLLRLLYETTGLGRAGLVSAAQAGDRRNDPSPLLSLYQIPW